MEVYFNSIKWSKYHNVTIQDEPCNKNIYLSKKEAKLLLKKTGAYFIRYTNDFDCDKATEFWYVIKEGKSSMEELSTKTRNQVRRGLKNCLVKRVNVEFIADNGYEVYKKAFLRYETELKPISKENYYNNIMIARKDVSYEFFGVFEKETGELIAYSKNRIQDNVCNYVEIKFIPEFLKLYSSYALFYEMNNYYLNEKGCKYVVDGARSINHKTNIQDYLIDKFKFRKAYCKLNINYCTKLKIIIKLIYPFRKLLYMLKGKNMSKVNLLICHEKIRRSCCECN